MLNYFKIFIFLLISQSIISCTLKPESNNVQSIKKLNESKVIDETLIKYFDLSWKLQPNMTELSKETRKEAQKICKHKRIVLIKIDTNADLIATGKFKCKG